MVLRLGFLTAWAAPMLAVLWLSARPGPLPEVAPEPRQVPWLTLEAADHGFSLLQSKWFGSRASAAKATEVQPISQVCRSSPCHLQRVPASKVVEEGLALQPGGTALPGNMQGLFYLEGGTLFQMPALYPLPDKVLSYAPYGITVEGRTLRWRGAMFGPLAAFGQTAGTLVPPCIYYPLVNSLQAESVGTCTLNEAGDEVQECSAGVSVFGSSVTIPLVRLELAATDPQTHHGASFEATISIAGMPLLTFKLCPIADHKGSQSTEVLQANWKRYMVDMDADGAGTVLIPTP